MRAFIFDLDGVIVSTDRFHYRAWKQMADRIGISFDESFNNRLRGVSRAESLEIILERSDRILSQEQKKELLEEKNRIYRSYLGTMTPADVADEVRETLNELRKAGYLLAVGSSSKNAGYILGKVDLTGYFDAVSDGNNITYSKPHPEVFEKAADFLEVEAEDCFVVEDAEAGIDAAKAAGMQAAGIGPAAGYEKTDISINRFGELLNLV